MMPPAPTLSPEAKYRLLLKLSQEIGRSLDLQEVMGYLLESVRTAVEFDAAGVFVLNRRVPLGQDTGGRLIAGMAAVGFDDTPRDEDPMLRRGEGIIGHVIATGETVIAPDVRLNPHYVQGKRSTRSEIAVPIASGGDVLGALNLESDTLDAFSDADVEYLEFFAVAAAISIEKAVLHREMLEKHRIEQQLGIAREVQKALLPAANPVLDGYDIAGTNVPTWEIGGDYFDYLPQPDGRLGIAIGDVAGKGGPAALIMATLRPALRAQRASDVPLDAVARRLNRILLDSMDASRFVTAFYGLLEPGTGAIGFANCGHNPPLLLRAAGACDVLASGGPALGMWHAATFVPGAAFVLPGDILVLYTDGVVEVMNADGEMFGIDRLEAVIRQSRGASSRDVVQAVVDATRVFAGREGYEDDFTLVIVRREVVAAGRAG
ncbi:MAG: SpoIIE family protein phosphatase [Vicinamibacterales bacterium]